MKPVLGFTRNALLRHSAERDSEALARHGADPGRLTVIVAGDTPVLRRGNPSTALLAPEDLTRLGTPEETVFL
jgi:NAD+ diphosphatase